MCFDLFKRFKPKEIPQEEPLEMSGVERPSPSDIVPRGNITVDSFYDTVTIDFNNLNIPFTETPKVLPIMGIPDSNSMDGLMDYGHNPLYIEAADEENHKILVDWLVSEFVNSDGMLANDCVYRVMVNDNDDPKDFTKPHLSGGYAIHRIYAINYDGDFIFKGINNHIPDPYPVKGKNILFLNTGIIF